MARRRLSASHKAAIARSMQGNANGSGNRGNSYSRRGRMKTLTNKFKRGINRAHRRGYAFKTQAQTAFRGAARNLGNRSPIQVRIEKRQVRTNELGSDRASFQHHRAANAVAMTLLTNGRKASTASVLHSSTAASINAGMKWDKAAAGKLTRRSIKVSRRRR